MIVCIDTNTLLQSRVPTHRYFPILDAIVAGRLAWAVSNRVLTEYAEILTRMSGPAAWTKVSRLIDLIDRSGNLVSISPHFQFRIIGDDPDDNKKILNVIEDAHKKNKISKKLKQVGIDLSNEREKRE